MIKWLKEEFTKTPGYMRVNLSLLMILASSSVLSTGLQIQRTVSNTSEESISYRNENLKEASDVLRQSLTGSGITEALTNLNKTLKNTVEIISEEKSYPSTQPLEK
jgi:hypothetical protein